MTYFTELGHLGLFLSAFLAATILPLSSEVVLTSLLLHDDSAITLVATATLGNVLGSLTNYALGYWAGFHVIKKWLRMSSQELEKAESRFRKYGLWSLCLAWVPIIGDPLTVIAGVLRVPLLWFVLLVTLGKSIRYIVLAWMVLQIGQ